MLIVIVFVSPHWYQKRNHLTQDVRCVHFEYWNCGVASAPTSIQGMQVLWEVNTFAFKWT
eukprot:4667099-Lingulodinium_polyedra.AAC.1